MLFRRRGFAPALAIAGNHTVSQDIEDRIILDRAHEVGRFHDFVSGVQSPGRPRVRQFHLQDQQAKYVSPVGPCQSHPSQSCLRLNCLQSCNREERDRKRVREREETRNSLRSRLLIARVTLGVAYWQLQLLCDYRYERNVKADSTNETSSGNLWSKFYLIIFLIFYFTFVLCIYFSSSERMQSTAIELRSIDIPEIAIAP